jgi:hypothetical protein
MKQIGRDDAKKQKWKVNLWKLDFPESSDASEADPTCTLCGRVFADRQNFNAHIRDGFNKRFTIVTYKNKLPLRLAKSHLSDTTFGQHIF